MIGRVNADLPTAPQKPTPEKTVQAAEQFESLLIAQMLRTIRESGTGWLGTGEDSAGSAGIEMAEQQFATLLASRGGLGLARMVAAGLEQQPSRPPVADAPVK